jgi:hypothetical protein
MNRVVENTLTTLAVTYAVGFLMSLVYTLLFQVSW